MFRILVVEDHENIRNLIIARLEAEGYHAFSAADGEEALMVMEDEHIDMLIADIMMPNMDGFELTEALRDAGYDLPILMVTAKEHIDDKREGFRAGTDDYMVKPIDFEELSLRVKALLRRAKINSDQRISIGDVMMDFPTMTATVAGEEISLTRKEFLLLYKLLSYPKKIFTRQDLMDEIWGMDSQSDDRTVDAHIKRIRQRFEHTDAFKIVTVRGLGYKAEKLP